MSHLISEVRSCSQMKVDYASCVKSIAAFVEKKSGTIPVVMENLKTPNELLERFSSHLKHLIEQISRLFVQVVIDLQTALDSVRKKSSPKESFWNIAEALHSTKMKSGNNLTLPSVKIICEEEKLLNWLVSPSTSDALLPLTNFIHLQNRNLLKDSLTLLLPDLRSLFFELIENHPGYPSLVRRAPRFFIQMKLGQNEMLVKRFQEILDEQLKSFSVSETRINQQCAANVINLMELLYGNDIETAINDFHDNLHSQPSQGVTEHEMVDDALDGEEEKERTHLADLTNLKAERERTITQIHDILNKLNNLILTSSPMVKDSTTLIRVFALHIVLAKKILDELTDLSKKDVSQFESAEHKKLKVLSTFKEFFFTSHLTIQKTLEEVVNHRKFEYLERLLDYLIEPYTVALMLIFSIAEQSGVCILPIDLLKKTIKKFPVLPMILDPLVTSYVLVKENLTNYLRFELKTHNHHNYNSKFTILTSSLCHLICAFPPADKLVYLPSVQRMINLVLVCQNASPVFSDRLFEILRRHHIFRNLPFETQTKNFTDTISKSKHPVLRYLVQCVAPFVRKSVSGLELNWDSSNNAEECLKFSRYKVSCLPISTQMLIWCHFEKELRLPCLFICAITGNNSSALHIKDHRTAQEVFKWDLQQAGRLWIGNTAARSIDVTPLFASSRRLTDVPPFPNDIKWDEHEVRMNLPALLFKTHPNTLEVAPHVLDIFNHGQDYLSLKQRKEMNALERQRREGLPLQSDGPTQHQPHEMQQDDDNEEEEKEEEQSEGFRSVRWRNRSTVNRIPPTPTTLAFDFTTNSHSRYTRYWLQTSGVACEEEQTLVEEIQPIVADDVRNVDESSLLQIQSTQILQLPAKALKFIIKKWFEEDLLRNAELWIELCTNFSMKEVHVAIRLETRRKIRIKTALKKWLNASRASLNDNSVCLFLPQSFSMTTKGEAEGEARLNAIAFRLSRSVSRLFYFSALKAGRISSFSCYDRHLEENGEQEQVHEMLGGSDTEGGMPDSEERKTTVRWRFSQAVFQLHATFLKLLRIFRNFENLIETTSDFLLNLSESEDSLKNKRLKVQERELLLELHDLLGNAESYLAEFNFESLVDLLTAVFPVSLSTFKEKSRLSPFLNMLSNFNFNKAFKMQDVVINDGQNKSKHSMPDPFQCLEVFDKVLMKKLHALKEDAKRVEVEEAFKYAFDQPGLDIRKLKEVYRNTIELDLQLKDVINELKNQILTLKTSSDEQD
eukprot:GDKK01062764.1.p1 GENE.GDKK01062764.1~~GDKK01062764.1.p1  ORF type:complete len:1420 (+),score=351.98 GDKK01062764.1:540-4262(+)